jgi:hypothetical protein
MNARRGEVRELKYCVIVRPTACPHAQLYSSADDVTVDRKIIK